MQAWHRTALVALVAFGAGALMATAIGVVGSVGESDGAVAPDAESPASEDPPPRDPPPKRDRVRVGAGEPSPSLDAGAVPNVGIAGTDLTAEEIEFLQRALAEERRRRRESVVTADDAGLEVVQRYMEHGADVSGLVSDYAAMRAHIRTAPGPVASIASTGDRTEVDLSEHMGKSGVIEFGPGTFVLKRGNGWNVPREDIESLEIRGAGMDETTLIGPGWAFLCCDEKASLHNLVIRDLTIDGAEMGQIVLDARGGIAAALERVRIRGWQVAGHAAPIGVSGSAYLAMQDCEIVGPGDGYALSFRGVGLAALERCLITDVDAVFIGPGGRDRAAVAHARDCRFENAKLADSRVARPDTGGVTMHVTGGKVAIGSAAMSEEERSERWGAKYAKSVEGVTFEDGTPGFSVQDALRVLALTATSGVQNVIGVDIHPGARDAPAEIDFYTLNATTAAVERITRIYDGTSLKTPKKATRRGKRGIRALEMSVYQSVRPLSELLARAQVPAGESVGWIQLRAGKRTLPDGTAETTVRCMVTTLDRRNAAMLDAITGELLTPRR